MPRRGRSGAGRPHGFDAGAFVGRGAELAALADLFARGERIVTVTGPAGVGKTRLVREVVTGARGPARDARFCDLAEAADRDAICHSVADALGLSHAAGRDLVGAVGRALARLPGAPLVVLDSFEHLATHGRATVGRWLEAAPGVRFLVTSRQVLRLAGEVRLDLGPLALPARGADDGGAEAVRLFVDRARRLRPDWKPGRAELLLVAEIVTRLDGLPLAIELAAARTNVLGLAALRDRLGEMIAPPPKRRARARGRRAAGRRATGVARGEQTLRDTIGWSWALLRQHEQSALAQVTSFRGGFDLDAAEAVVAPERGQAEARVEDVLQLLREKSLLRVTDTGSGTGALRMGLYTSVREFAEREAGAGALPAGTLAKAHERHARYYLRLGAELAAQIVAGGGREAVVRLAQEQENLNAAIDRTLAHRALGVDQVASVIEGLLAQDVVSAVRGPAEARARRLDAAIAAAQTAGAPPVLTARALRARSTVRWRRGHAAEAASDLDAALAIARRLEDPRLEGHLAREIGRLRQSQGKLDQAGVYYEEAIAQLERAGDVRGVSMSLLSLASARVEAGHAAEGRAHADRAAELARRSGDQTQHAWTEYLVGLAAHDQGRLDEALEHYDAAAAGFRALNDPYEGTATAMKATALLERGKAREAEPLLDRAYALMRDVDRLFEAVVVALRAASAAQQGDVRGADEHLDAAYAIARDTDVPSLVDVLGVVRGLVEAARARAAASARRPQEAAEHRQRARQLRARALEPGPPDADYPDGAPSPYVWSLAVRMMIRLLDAALGTGEATSGAKALVVHADGDWFEPPGLPRVQTRHRRVVRRLLALLAERRLDAPGEAISTERLIAQGWPGERMAPDSARNRLYVTIAGLRGLGLRGLLQGGPEGYFLDPKTPLVLAHGAGARDGRA